MVENKNRSTAVRQGLIGIGCFLVLITLTTSAALAARAMKPLEMKQRYQQVLGVLSTGDLDQALAGLVEFELLAVGDQQSWRYVDNLWRAKLRVIRDGLATQPPEMLMPIIVLHHDAYFRYAEMDRAHLAQHSRTMVSELAQIFAQRSGTPGAGVFAGWALTSFGSYLWSPSNIGMSADLFYRAHMLDPGNETALEGLAAAWERSGNYEKAIESLTKARRLEPDNPELQLRLALCQMRFPEGARQEALAQLIALTQSDAPSWVQSVAFQELARAQAASDDPGRAETTLREGLRRLPGDQQISLQLASILDAQRRRQEANSILDAIEIYGWDRESSRQTYDFWKPPELSGVRAELRLEMHAGLQALAAGFAGLAIESGGS
jgi:tetratricopeptide (TPR) repeat protein